MTFSGDFTPVLAKHSKSLNLLDSISVGVDCMQRNFAPMQKQVEAWQADFWKSGSHGSSDATRQRWRQTGRVCHTALNLVVQHPPCLQIFTADRFVAARSAAGAMRVASVKIRITAGLSSFRKRREEVFSLRVPVCNYLLSVSVLDNRVRNTNGQEVFDEDAVGQDLNDVTVAGTIPRAPSGFQLNGNDTMIGVDQVVWPPGEPIPM